jgi:hypothetical protein
MIVVASVRGDPGRAIADTTLLVILAGIVAALDFIVSRFMDTGYAASLVIILVAGGFALDSLYGLLAPERQKRRDKKLRRLMKRRA